MDFLKHIFRVLSFCLIGITVSAQNNSKPTENHLKLICRNTNDSVILRWAPNNHIQWSRLNRYGYKVERFVIDLNSKSKPKAEILNSDSLKPWPINKWKSSFPLEHPYAPAAVQALYGKSFQAGQLQSNVTQIRNQSQEAELRYSMAILMADLDARVADGLALRWVDKNPPSDKRIQYRIISLDPLFPDTASAGINRMDPIEILPIPLSPEIDEGDKSVQLRWNTHPEAPVFTAWWLERSEDGKSWKRTSTSPLIKSDSPLALYPEPFLYFTDTLIQKNYTPYYYRLIGISPFGELSSPSEIITAMGRDRSAPPSPDIQATKDIGGQIQISWKYLNPPADLKGFWIGKSSFGNGPFDKTQEELLSKTIRSWTDKNANPLGDNYYVVYAIDTAGNTSASQPVYGFLRDSIAPGKPEKPGGTIDTSGIVRLHWKKGNEKDILGYRVYFGNAPDHEFSILTPTPKSDTTFTDTITLNTLTKRIYYRIVAVDRNFNHSVYSEMLSLKKPDILPPVEPLISDYHATDSSVVIQFIPSSSSDVMKHDILRRDDEKSNWTVVGSFNNPLLSTSFTDLGVNSDIFYQYSLQATDSSGNKSPLAPIADIKVVKKYTKESLRLGNASYNKEKRAVELSWKTPQTAVKYYVIYRGKDGRSPSSVSSSEGTISSFSDTNLVGNGRYVYMIKTIFKDGSESPFMSFPEVEVR